MPRRPQKEAKETRERILASALTLFAEKGYVKTTFNDIAAELKMTKGAVYWHFESKEVLLLAIVERMLKRFEKIVAYSVFGEGASYPEVTDKLVRHALVLVTEPEGVRFFMLMKTQICWRDASMAKVRENLLTDKRFGPVEALRRALAEDLARGRVRSDIDVEQVVFITIAMWDGLIQGYIDHFLHSDLEKTLRNGLNAIWHSIRVETTKKLSKKRGTK